MRLIFHTSSPLAAMSSCEHVRSTAATEEQTKYVDRKPVMMTAAETSVSRIPLPVKIETTVRASCTMVIWNAFL